MITGSHYANSPVVITEQVRDVTYSIFTSGSSAETYAAGLLGLFFSEKMREVWVGELKNEGDLCQVFYASFLSLCAIPSPQYTSSWRELNVSWANTLQTSSPTSNFPQRGLLVNKNHAHQQFILKLRGHYSE